MEAEQMEAARMEAAQQFPGDGHDMSMAAATDDALVIESPKGTPRRRRTANVSRRSLPDGGGEPRMFTCSVRGGDR